MLDRGATPEAVSRIVHWEDISRDAATPKAETTSAGTMRAVSAALK